MTRSFRTLQVRLINSYFLLCHWRFLARRADLPEALMTIDDTNLL